MEFKLTEEQQERLDRWHNDCSVQPGTIGGRLSITFTPTGLGNLILAKCLCGETIDLTDSNNW